MTGPSVETDARECQRHLDHSSDVFIVLLQVPAAIALSPLSIVELHLPFFEDLVGCHARRIIPYLD